MADRLADVRAVLLDLDGVLYVEGEAVPGAPDAVARLRGAGLPLRFVTNTTARSREQTLARLAALGFEVAPSELVTPAALAAQMCAQRGLHRVALVMNDAVKGDFPGLEEADDGVEAVIMGDLGEQMGYATLNRAFRHVMAGAELIALQKNRFWLTADGLALDAGPFVAAIEYATGRQADVVGKPSAAFFELVLADLGTDAAHAAMVGDDVEVDVGGAQAAGLAGILVRTGKYRADVVAASGVRPAAVAGSIADVPALLHC
ncbi:MAG: TIGR01458 family HAD-type hydrolase [Solirubrobacteraceae bacterium]